MTLCCKPNNPPLGVEMKLDKALTYLPNDVYGMIDKNYIKLMNTVRHWDTVRFTEFGFPRQSA